MAEPRTKFSVRLRNTDLTEIDHKAQQHKLTRSEYITRASLGLLGELGLGDRVTALERRVERLEQIY